MSEMVVKLTWHGEDLGPMWMNPDNLALLLYSDMSVSRKHLRVTLIGHSEMAKDEMLEHVVPERIEMKPRSLEEVGREVMRKLKRDARREAFAQDARFTKIDQFGFTIDSTDV
jgi:hypothetical protein